MKDIKKLDGITCMRDECSKDAVVRVKTSTGEPLELCPTHEEKFAEKIREKVQNQFEGMDKDEIAEKMVNEGEFIF